MADNEYYYTEFPDIQGLIKQLDLMNENVNKAVREGINKGADIILAEQKRLAPEKLSEYISKGKLYVTKKGVVGISNTDSWFEKWGLIEYDGIKGWIALDYTRKTSVDKLAKEVIQGKWGNGDERKDRLGSLYDEVQKRVNQIYRK